MSSDDRLPEFDPGVLPITAIHLDYMAPEYHVLIEVTCIHEARRQIEVADEFVNAMFALVYLAQDFPTGDAERRGQRAPDVA
jgi:hypothetical protein